MAITVNQIPDSFLPVGNELVISVQSNEEAQPLFGYLVKLYENLVLVQTLLYPPRPEGGVKFDPSRILQNYVSFDIQQITGFDVNLGLPNDIVSNAFVQYKVDFLEQYGATQQTYASAEVSGLIAINGALQWQQWYNLVIDDYLNQNGTLSTFLTNSPRNIKVGFNERVALGFMAKQNPGSIFPVPWGNIKVISYNESGNQIASATILVGQGGFDPDNQFQTIFVSPVDLNAVYQLQAAQNAVPINAAYYQLWLADDDTEERTSEVFTFTIDDLCTKFQTFRIHFLNRWGRIDSFTFKGDTDFMTSATDNTFTRAEGYADGQSWLYAANRHSMVNFSTPYENKYMLKAAFVTVEEKEWLEELMTSPAVWWQAGANNDPTNMWAVNISRTSDYKKEQNGLFSAMFEMKLSTGSNTQNR